MSATIKKVLTLSLVALLLLCFSGAASARKQGPVWKKGTVTNAAWTEGQKTYIELDGDKYEFLPLDRVKFERQYRTPKNQWVVEKLALDKINIGTEVLIRGEGMQIYQLIVEEP